MKNRKTGKPDIKIGAAPKERGEKKTKPLDRKLDRKEKTVRYTYDLRTSARSSTGEVVRNREKAEWTGYMEPGSDITTIARMKKQLPGGKD